MSYYSQHPYYQQPPQPQQQPPQPQQPRPNPQYPSYQSQPQQPPPQSQPFANPSYRGTRPPYHNPAYPTQPPPPHQPHPQTQTQPQPGYYPYQQQPQPQSRPYQQQPAQQPQGYQPYHQPPPQPQPQQQRPYHPGFAQQPPSHPQQPPHPQRTPSYTQPLPYQQPQPAAQQPPPQPQPRPQYQPQISPAPHVSPYNSGLVQPIPQQPQPQPQPISADPNSNPNPSPKRRALPTPVPRQQSPAPPPQSAPTPPQQNIPPPQQQQDFIPTPSRVKSLAQKLDADAAASSNPSPPPELPSAGSRRMSLNTSAVNPAPPSASVNVNSKHVPTRSLDSTSSSMIPTSSFDIPSRRTSVAGSGTSPTKPLPTSSFDLPGRRASLSSLPGTSVVLGPNGRPLPRPPSNGSGSPEKGTKRALPTPTPPRTPVRTAESLKPDPPVIVSPPPQATPSRSSLASISESPGHEVAQSDEEEEDESPLSKNGDGDKELPSLPSNRRLSKIQTPPKLSSSLLQDSSESDEDEMENTPPKAPSFSTTNTTSTTSSPSSSPPTSPSPISLLSRPPTFTPAPSQHNRHHEARGEPQSMALRMAKMSLMEEEEEGRNSWPRGVPRLPKTRTIGGDLDDTPPKPMGIRARGPPPARNSNSTPITTPKGTSGNGRTPQPQPQPQKRALPPSPTPPVVPPSVNLPPSPSLSKPSTTSFQVPVLNFPDDDDDDDSSPAGGGIPSISITASPKMIATISLPEEDAPSPSKSRSKADARGGSGGGSVGRGLRCAGCDNPIVGRIVSAMGRRWHPGCFKCEECGELLEHVSSFEHEGRAYCHLDYHEHFAPRCHHCKTPIADERFITLDDPSLGGQRYYHELHFFCAECGDPFLDPARSLAAPPGQETHLKGKDSDDVGFTIYQGHPYCESCHVRLRMPKCGSKVRGGGAGGNGFGCGKAIREEALEALGRKWHWECFVCDTCNKPFEDPAFFQREDKAFCDPCYRLLLKSEM